MKARAALSKVLADSTLAKNDLFEKSLEIARIHKMGTTSLRKLTKDLFDAESSAESVEDAVEKLVESAFLSLQRSTELEEVDIIDASSNEEQPLGNTVSVHNEGSLTHSTHLSDGNTNEDTVSVPVTVLQSLIVKIDRLAKTVEKQREELRDVEKRLKAEMKFKEKRLSEEISTISLDLKGFFSDSSRKLPASSSKNRSSKRESHIISAREQHLADVTVLDSEVQNTTTEKPQKSVPVNASKHRTLKQTVPQTIISSSTTGDAAIQLDPVTNMMTDGENTGEWTTVLRRTDSRKTKPLRTQPKSNRKPLGKLMGATRIKKTVFYLGGVSPECSAEDIHSFCDSHCSLIDCRMLPSRRFGTQAARIVVQEDYATILEAIEWPQHLHLRRWNFHNSGTESGSGAEADKPTSCVNSTGVPAEGTIESRQ